MSTYKLLYYNLRGRGEVTRFLFAQANVPYTDERIEFKDWPEKKGSTPYGCMPLLEVNNKDIIAGSIVIPRYLAELPEFNLAGSNAIENAQIAGLGDFLHDLEGAFVKLYVTKEEDKEEAKKSFLEKDIPKFFGKLENLSFSSPNGYLWNDKLTWTDFYFYELYEWIVPTWFTRHSLLENFPSLMELVKTIEALPNIAKWLKERPKTDL